MKFVQCPYGVHVVLPKSGNMGCFLGPRTLPVSGWWLTWLNKGNNAAGDWGESCQGPETSRDGTVGAGGFVGTGNLVLEGCSVAQVSLHPLFRVRPLSLLFALPLSALQHT